MLIAGLDFETTGLNAQEDQITEIGAVLWDTELNTPVSFFHRFCRVDAPLSDLIIELTGITDGLLSKYGVSQTEGMVDLVKFLKPVNVVVAHNAKFDQGFFDAACASMELENPDPIWINSITHVPYPKRIKSKNLITLAAEHGFLNPFPHRAVTDVLTMLTIIGKYDFNEILGMQTEPILTLWARVTYAEKDKAKGAGFYYDGTQKAWYKEIMEKDLEVERNRCDLLGFAIEVIKSENK